MRKIAIVLGGAKGVWDEHREAIALIDEREHIVIACNHAFRDAPFHVDEAVTMHPELFPTWIRFREHAGRPPAGRYWHARHRPCSVKASQIPSWGGSSGLLCVAVAFELQCSRIILAGVPMDKMLGHYDDAKPWYEARQYWPSWDRKIPFIATRVRSMSGWTRERLGAPTQEWLDG